MQEILLVEDDQEISQLLSELLRKEGFSPRAVTGQQAAEQLLARQVFDLALVDLSLSDGTGYGVCAAAGKRQVPVIFLTASGDESSVVAGLEMGADDYVAKPFRPRELISRIRGVLRRNSGGQSVLQLGPVVVDPERGVVLRDGAEISCTALEYRLLLTLISNRGRVLSRTRLLEEIWDAAGDFVNDNTLTVYIKRLREKIEEDPQNPVLIRTVRGIGYRVDG